MSNKPETGRFYRSLPLIVTPPSYHPLNLSLALLLTALLLGWLLGLGTTNNPQHHNQQHSEPMPPIAVITLMGALHGRLPVEATCSQQRIAVYTVAERGSTAPPELPLGLTLESLEPLDYGYYSLSPAATSLRLDVLDADGNSTRRFQALEGTVDIRPQGLYIVAQLRDETSALLYITVQASCQPTASAAVQ